jgi:replicative superfamily II helicase
MHHAGMLRSDRNLVERLFRDGILKVTNPWHLSHTAC